LRRISPAVLISPGHLLSGTGRSRWDRVRDHPRISVNG
jgi:hypothetical protein